MEKEKVCFEFVSGIMIGLFEEVWIGVGAPIQFFSTSVTRKSHGCGNMVSGRQVRSRNPVCYSQGDKTAETCYGCKCL